MRKTIFILFLFASSLHLSGQVSLTYQKPSKEILDLVDVLLSEKDMQYESDEFNMKAEIQKIIGMSE